jgi:ATP-dependent helicase/nuclease subunit A
LRFLLNPHDNINFFELLRSPWFYVPDQKIIENFGGKKSFSFWSEVSEHPDFSQLKTYLEWRETSSITEVFRRALVEVGFFDYSHVLDVTGRREANLWKLVNDLEQATRQPGFSFLDFSRQKMHEITLEVKEDQDAVSARESHRINLMTVHQSKGLQFEHVIVLDIDAAPSAGNNRRPWSFDEENGRVSFPVYLPEIGEAKKTLGDIHCQRITEQREQEEFARIFYVAVTRAVQSLVLIGREKTHEKSWQNLLALNNNETGFKYSLERGPWNVLPVAQIHEVKKSELKKLAVGETVKIEKLSVSQLVEREIGKKTFAKTKNANLLESLEISNRGILLHRVFESVKYQGLAAGLEVIDSFFGDQRDQLAAIKESLAWAYDLKNPNLADISGADRVVRFGSLITRPGRRAT